ncbi:MULTISPECIES: hypothetical protein [unclassified Nocardioides]|uniref:hypothetical protein n=1 Tax=unclassified Nocardioides TaxID=2615069 RepID=UPI003612560A
MRPIAPALLALALSGALVGCSDSDGSGGGTDWPSGEAAVDTSGPVYAIGDTVHLGDGSTVTVGAGIERFVVTGAGIFFTAGGPLLFSPGDGTSREVAPDASEMRVSDDGRYLMLMDMESGEKDGFGTPQAEVVVVDTSAGEEVARATDELGDPDSDDDLADLYEDAEPRLLGFADGAAYYDGAGDVVAIDLETGDTTVTEEAGFTVDVPPYDDRLSPDGQWRIVDVQPAYTARDRLVAESGATVMPSGVPPTVDLLWWVDDTTAAGVSVDGRANAFGFTKGTSATLVTCAVPSGRCTVVDGTSGETVHVPEGTVDPTSFELPDGS